MRHWPFDIMGRRLTTACPLTSSSSSSSSSWPPWGAAVVSSSTKALMSSRCQSTAYLTA